MSALPRYAGEFASLYDRCFHSLVAFARKRLRSLEDAEDAVNEAFARLIQRANFSEIRAPEAYLRAALNRVIIDQFRSRKLKNRYLVFEATQAEVSPIEDLADEYERRHRARLLREAIPLLDSRQRRVVGLRLRGLDTHQIAALESTTPHRVTMMTGRAKKSLKDKLIRRGWIPAFSLSERSVRLRWRIHGAQKRLLFISPVAVAVQGAVLATVFAVSGGLVHVEDWAKPATSPGVARVAAVPAPAVAHPPIPLIPKAGYAPVLRGPPGYSNQRRTVAGLQTSHGELEVSHRDENGGPAPTLGDQLQEIVQHPEKLLTVQCGDLPGCSSS
jgi:RNA polymerase sigma-70 factor (ECF subfamily)